MTGHNPGERALILDFGGVISRTLFETHALSEQALGLPPGTLTWRGPFAPADDALWRRMQADEISERDYYLQRAREVGALLGEEWDSMETLVRRARGSNVETVIRPEAIAIVQAAKSAGCKLAILSNELDLFYGAGFRDRLALLQQFDVIVDATYTQVLKPNPRAYLGCTEALGLEPACCVFVDDQLRNVNGARAVGLPTVHFDVHTPQVSFDAALKLLTAGQAAPT